MTQLARRPQEIVAPYSPELKVSGTLSKLQEIYDARFDEKDFSHKDRLWRELTRHLQRYIPESATVLDIGCDKGYFIRNIRACEKWTTDLRDMSVHLTPEIKFLQADGLSLTKLLLHLYFDTVFMSNYLEHLPSSESVVQQLEDATRLLRPGGHVLILRPNIRLIGGRYWDFIDHTVALTDTSLAEAAHRARLKASVLIARFLPCFVVAKPRTESVGASVAS
jgi:2-polyprenyl-3-methyl-5-hydroxy-6-metoxy-1,4-benzoquinol methylase